jgi:3-oxoacyl-[acyl-carrier-protein] synthase II
MKMALERRGVPADEVDLINPHGTSTPLGDKREAEAIWSVFGSRSARDARSLAISATKSMTGHMMGAAGANRRDTRRWPGAAINRRWTNWRSWRI